MEIRQIVQDVKKKIIQLRISLLSTLRNIKYLTNHTVLKVNYQLPLEQNSIWLRPVLICGCPVKVDKRQSWETYLCNAYKTHKRIAAENLCG